jgi:CRP-like cAMP-binding protein
MIYASVPANKTLFNQGSVGTYFYIIKSGSVDLFINDLYIKTMNPGDGFGDLALLHDAKRSGTVIATVYSELWCLERRKFRNIIEFINKQNYEENKAFVQSVSILSNNWLI